MSAEQERRYVSDIAFTDSVKAAQEAYGSRASCAKMEEERGWATAITPDLASFIGELDMFYLSTASADGQPSIQYRGGPPGFLQVLGERTLGFADFAGNQQFISSGNLAENPKAFIFLIDCVNRRRVKIWGTARVVQDDPDLLECLSDEDCPAKIERSCSRSKRGT